MSSPSGIDILQPALSDYSAHLNKRRRLNRMDFHMHQARLARVQEPLFCPRTIIALTPSYSYPLDYRQECNLISAGPSSRQLVDSGAAPAAQERTAYTEYNWAESVRDEPEFSRVSAASQPTGFGFEGGAIANQWIGDRLQARSHFSRQESSINYSISQAHDTIDHTVREPSPIPSRTERSEAGQPTDAMQWSWLQQSRTPQPASDDEDALDVDDPRRSYDFANFMHDWRLLYLTGENVLPFEPGPQPSVKLGSSTHLITQDQAGSRHLDMQGLCWNQLGPNREDALRTRRQLHPSRRYEAIENVPTPIHPSPVSYQQRKMYNARSFHPTHRAHSSHYQLRNVITASGRSSVYYATRYEVVQTSLACPDVKATVLNLASSLRTEPPVKITCLSTFPDWMHDDHPGKHVLLAGGFSGEFAMVDPTSEQPNQQIEGFVTHAYNGIINHICTSANRRSGLPEATFSSNDCTVRTMDIKTQIFFNTFTHDHAMNCSAISPDCRLRILVGDSNDALITDAETGDPLVTLTEHSDHAFACAWSSSGNMVATGAQDGKVVLWDARNWSAPLRTLDASMSCVRSLHFTDDDLLVAAESEDVVTIHDPRDFEQRQDIQFFGSIAGVSLLDGGAEIVVANADQTVGGLFTLRRASMASSYGFEHSSIVGYESRSASILGREVLV